MSAKVFRDPLDNYVSIERARDGWLLDVLNSPEIQRLRRIHQLGVGYYIPKELQKDAERLRAQWK